MLRLNPDTRDVVDRLGVDGPDDVRLLVMGGVQRAGGGCLCPETRSSSAAIAGMRLREGDVVVMDTHAGVEHFGRALARGFDRALVVVTPTFNAVQVGLRPPGSPASSASPPSTWWSTRCSERTTSSGSSR